MGRKIIIVRHGERMDFTFGDWITACFDKDGKYQKKNLNMPDSVPAKKGAPETHMFDCPLTQIGHHQAFLVGKGLAQQDVLKDDFEIFVSPALRCVETATHVLRGMGKEKKLKIEPGLFEWTGFTPNKLPQWFTTEELKAAGFNIDGGYKAWKKNVEMNETVEAFYDRNHEAVLHCLKQTDKDLLLVAHGVTIESGTRQLVGGQKRSVKDMMKVLQFVPYCAVGFVEENASGKWSLQRSPSEFYLRHSEVQDFDAYSQLSDSVSNGTVQNKPLH